MRRAEVGAKIFGVFRVKNHDFTPTNHIFSNFRGGARRVCPPPPWILPCLQKSHEYNWNTSNLTLNNNQSTIKDQIKVTCVSPLFSLVGIVMADFLFVCFILTFAVISGSTNSSKCFKLEFPVVIWKHLEMLIIDRG